MFLAETMQRGVVRFLYENSREGAIYSLAKTLAEIEKGVDREHLYAAIMKREKIASTGIGMGIAIPHAKIEGYSRFALAVGIHKNGMGIEWNAPDHLPVKLIFTIGGPPNRQVEYLNILSDLTAWIKKKGLPGGLLAAGSEEEATAFLKK